MAELPLGTPENERLEFKGRDALRRPERIAREVVGMLNGEGGEVWVGLGEEDGIARRLEPIEDPRVEVDRVWDCLVQRIEPRLRHDDVSIEPVAQGHDSVLRVRVGSGGRGPYAYLDRGTRAFLRRVGRRIVEMSREELRAAFAREVGDTNDRASELGSLKDKVVAEGKPLLWLGAISIPALRLELHPENAHVRRLMRDPSLSDNRSSGWTVMNTHTATGHDATRAWEEARALDWRLELTDAGVLQFHIPLDRLTHGTHEELYPLAVEEFPTSFCRLLAAILRSTPGDGWSGRVQVDLALQGLEGWRLWPYAPDRAGWKHEFFAKPPLDRDLITTPRPFEFDGALLMGEPDACGWELVRFVYLEFGYEDDVIPHFDRETKELILPR